MKIFNILKATRNNLFKKENIFFIFFITFIFGLDRFSKILVINKFNENRHYINDYINLDLIWNTGIGFGLLDTNSNTLYEITTTLIIIVILILFVIMINSTIVQKINFSFISGGALGNLYDRILFKAVPDFIDLHYNNFHWFTFNVADIFITIGVIMFLIQDFKKND